MGEALKAKFVEVTLYKRHLHLPGKSPFEPVSPSVHQEKGDDLNSRNSYQRRRPEFESA